MNKKLFILACVLILVQFPKLLRSYSFELDTSFGQGGFIKTDLIKDFIGDNHITTDYIVRDVFVQHDGKIIVGGGKRYSFGEEEFDESDTEFLVLLDAAGSFERNLRYYRSGSFDFESEKHWDRRYKREFNFFKNFYWVTLGKGSYYSTRCNSTAVNNLFDFHIIQEDLSRQEHILCLEASGCGFPEKRIGQHGKIFISFNNNADKILLGDQYFDNFAVQPDGKILAWNECYSPRAYEDEILISRFFLRS